MQLDSTASLISRRHAGDGLMRRSGRGGDFVASGSSASPPVLTPAQTATGSEIGGTAITWNGTGLANVTGVTVGGVAATGVSSTTTSVTFTTPSIVASPGVTFVGRATLPLSSTAADNTCDVVVTTAAGSSTLAGAYTYTSELVRLGATNEGRVSDPRITIAGGTTVSNVPDFLANGAYAQATGAAQPAYSASSYHGGPGATFDGTDDWLLNTLGTSIAVGKRPSIFIVAQCTSLPASIKYFMTADNAATTTVCRLGVSNATFRCARTDSSGSANANSASRDTNRHLIEGHFDATGALTLVVDGVATSTALTGTVTSTAIIKIALGTTTAGGANFVTGVAAHWCAFADGAAGATLTAARAFLNGAYFPGYTSSSYV